MNFLLSHKMFLCHEFTHFLANSFKATKLLENIYFVIFYGNFNGVVCLIAVLFCLLRELSALTELP